jgi:hypothetical protein
MHTLRVSVPLLAACLALPVVAQSPAPLLSAVRPGFEAHAPRPDDLARAVEAAEQASREYRKYFGAEPPRFALVLFDDEAQRLANGDDRFRARGLRALHWPAQTRGNRAGMAWGEVGVFLAEEEGGQIRVVALYPGGPFAGAGLRRGDRVTRVNGAAISSLRQMAELRTALATGSQVVLGVERDGAPAELRFTYPERSTTPPPREAVMAALASAPLIPTSRSTLAHEVGHHLLHLRFGDRQPPVWFHEGFASLMEDPEPRAQKRAAARAGQLPLATLVSMPHPASGGTVLADSTGRAPAAGAPVRVAVASRPGAPGGAEYYGRSMSLLEWVAERRGPRAVAELAQKLAEGETLHGALAAADLADVEREWLRWLGGADR